MCSRTSESEHARARWPGAAQLAPCSPPLPIASLTLVFGIGLLLASLKVQRNEFASMQTSRSEPPSYSIANTGAPRSEMTSLHWPVSVAWQTAPAGPAT